MASYNKCMDEPKNAVYDMMMTLVITQTHQIHRSNRSSKKCGKC